MGKRMFYILKIIQSQKDDYIKAKDIRKKLEEYDIFVDIKTIYSCIQKINEFFYDWIKTDMIVSQHKLGYRIEHEFFIDGELQFLLDSIAFHQDLDIDDKMMLKQKLLQLSSFHQQQRLINFEPKQKELSFSLFLNLSVIMKAIENKTVISFQYINYQVKNQQLSEVPSLNGNNKDQYIISPYQIVSNNNHYYLIGYNNKHKNTLTTYRIDRMRFIRSIHQPFIEVREQFDISDEIEKMTNMYISNERATLKIECKQSLLREVASHFGTEVEVQQLHNYEYLITIYDIPLSEGLIGWMMMLQDQIKVIEPLSLQKEMKNRIMKMATLYDDVL